MKSSWEIGATLGEEFREILHFDQIEIDRPDRHHRMRLHYMDRLRVVVSIIKRNFPEPEGIKVGDFGCAQGNTSLILAELGYQVYATDINPAYVEYSKRKYEGGNIQWIVSNIRDLVFPADLLDVAILGETLCFFPDPETIVKRVMGYLRAGGLLIITSDNGHRFRMPALSLREFREGERRERLAAKQFIASTLFTLTPEEFTKFVMPPNAVLVEETYCGGTILINKYSQSVVQLLPLSWAESCNRLSCKIPLLNRWIANNLCLVLRKQ
ncbi:MAG: class I SAM-dependent methyltransferase [Acidobacteria bacterium]|nr:class I SAM-dependent methyltransferase [Acidobacteriota bacterium]